MDIFKWAFGLLLSKLASGHDLSVNKPVLVIDLFSHAFWYFTLYFTGQVSWGNYTHSPASTYVAAFSS